VASALLAIEPSLRKIKGGWGEYKHFQALRNAMKNENFNIKKIA